MYSDQTCRPDFLNIFLINFLVLSLPPALVTWCRGLENFRKVARRDDGGSLWMSGMMLHIVVVTTKRS